MDNQLRQIIEEAWNDRALLAESRVREAVRAVIEELDKGRLRTAEPIDPSRSQWQVNEWVKKAILLYFPMQEMRTMRAGELEWHDKMDLKHGYEELGVRVVPHAVARYGAYISPGAILMPSYVNIGAWVGAGTMVDTWATVGSCAQVGERVHLSGGVGVGGVLEPVPGGPRHHRGRLFHRLPGHRGRRGAHLPRIGAGRRRGDYRIDAYYRRNGGGTQTVQGIRPRRIGGHSGQLPQAFPGRGVRRSLCADYRTPQGVHRQENFTHRGAPGFRSFGIVPFGCTRPVITFSKRRPRPTTRPGILATNTAMRSAPSGRPPDAASGGIPGAARRDAT